MEVLKAGMMSVCFTRCDVILLCYDTFRADIPVEREDLGQQLSGLAHFLYNTSLPFLPATALALHTIPQHIHVFALLYCFPPHTLYYVTTASTN